MYFISPFFSIFSSPRLAFHFTLLFLQDKQEDTRRENPTSKAKGKEAQLHGKIVPPICFAHPVCTFGTQLGAALLVIQPFYAKGGGSGNFFYTSERVISHACVHIPLWPKVAIRGR
jgi:hypothetical protein